MIKKNYNRAGILATLTPFSSYGWIYVSSDFGFIGLRYLRGRSGDRFSRFVSYMSTAGITIGVMSLVTVLSVMNGFEAQLKSRILGVLPQAVVSEAAGKTTLSATPPDFVTALSTQRPPEPLVRSEAVVQSASQLAAGLLIGIEPQQNDPIEQHLIAGRLTAFASGRSINSFLGIFLRAV